MVDAGSSSRGAWQGKAHFKIGTKGVSRNFLRGERRVDRSSR